MTIIAAIVEDGKIWMGGDSGVTWGETIDCLEESKVFRVGDFLIGSSGDCRVPQVMEYQFKPPLRSVTKRSDHYYMVDEFIPAFRECLSQNGCLRKSKDNIDYGCCFLVGFNGRVFNMNSDFSVFSTRKGYEAIGSGQDFAIGSLHTTEDYKMTPKVRLESALKAACRYSPGCCAPFKILSL